MKKLIEGALDKLMGGEFDPSKRRAVKGIGALPVGALGVAGAAKGVRELFAEGAFDKLMDDVRKDFIDVEFEDLDLSNLKKYFEDDKALSDWLDDGVVEDAFIDPVYVDGIEEGWFQNLDERLDYVTTKLENTTGDNWKDDPEPVVREILTGNFAQPLVTDIILQKHPHLTQDEVRDLVGKMVR